MCGRYTLATPQHEIVEQFPLFEAPELEPRYNIAPSQMVAAARIGEQDKKEIVLLRWGLIPSWADDPKIGYKLINARSETAATKPSFRSAYKKRRCLILADGFYEWKKIDKVKQPYYIRLKDEKLFAFAGLWEYWHKEEKEIESCTILTTNANEVLKPLHDRMPVILGSDDYNQWLDPGNTTGAGLDKLLRPFAADKMKLHPVDQRVNSPKYDEPNLVEPIEL